MPMRSEWKLIETDHTYRYVKGDVVTFDKRDNNRIINEIKFITLFYVIVRRRSEHAYVLLILSARETTKSLHAVIKATSGG